MGLCDQTTKSLNGTHGFISTKSHISLELTEWSIQHLLSELDNHGYPSAVLFSMMTLSIEHFHSTTHVKHILMSPLQYARMFMAALKESLKRGFPWSAYYFTNHKGSWYPPTEDSLTFDELVPFLPKKLPPRKTNKERDEELQSWAITYTRAVR